METNAGRIRSLFGFPTFLVLLLSLRHLQRFSPIPPDPTSHKEPTNGTTSTPFMPKLWTFRSPFTTDPDFGLEVRDIVAKRGFYSEEHHVTTQDGYVLTLFRLPKSFEESQKGLPIVKNKPVVLLMHGLLDSSFTWVANYRHQSLAFILADMGYDVWLGNNRGTTWSQQHTTWTTQDWQYWDFTWAELAEYDFPAIMQYVLSKTQRETISYIGHSEGSMQAFVAFSQDQELAKRVSFFAALGPVAFLGYDHTPSLVNAVFYVLRTCSSLFPHGSFLPRMAPISYYVTKYFCNPFPHLCNSVIEKVAGQSLNGNVTRVPVYGTQTPAGSSIKNVVHFAQIIAEKKFQNFNYGCNCDRSLPDDTCDVDQCANKQRYGTMDPPSYDLTKLRYPRLGFIEGEQDLLAAARSVEQTRSSLPNGTIVYQRRLPLNHVDFTWSPVARELFYDELIEVMQVFEGKGY